MGMVLTRFRGEQEHYRFARVEDLEPITAMLADPRVGEWLWFVPAPKQLLIDFFRPLIDGQWESLALGEQPQTAVFVVEDLHARYLGQGAAVAVDGSPGGFEIGYQLAAHAWGRGVGTRLAWFLAAWAVHAHQAYRVEASCLEGNLASQGVLTKIGLTREGRRPGYRLMQGARHTELYFGAEVEQLDGARLRELAEQTGILSQP